MAAYSYPQPADMERLAQKKGPALVERSVIWRFFRETDVNRDVLRWFQKDMYKGFQNWRGLGGKPSPVSFVGESEYMAAPGFYGDFMALDERELHSHSDPTNPDGPAVPIDSLVMEAQDELLRREMALKELILWQLLVGGTFSISRNTQVVYSGAYTQAAFTASVAWATVATATPFKDLLGLPILGRGLEVNFGAGASLLMNQKTANYLLLNTNAADLGGTLRQSGSSVKTIADVNLLLSLNGVPTIEICEEGYFTTGGTWTLYVPDNKFILVGKRKDTDVLGEYRNTRNINATKGYGSYSKVIEKKDDVPMAIEVHQGHNGGPVLEYPGSILKGNV